MNKIYRFKTSSLLSSKLAWLYIIFTILALTVFRQGLQGLYKASDEFGGLWIILILVIAAYAESFINLAGHRLEIKDSIFSLKPFSGLNGQFQY